MLMLVATVNVLGQSIQVQTSNYKQTIDMIGGDMERSSKAIQSAQNKQEIIEWSFQDINFNVCRVQYDKSQEMVEGTKDWSFYDKQVATMQAIKAVNPDIKFFATMRSDYDGYGDDNNLPDWITNYSTKVMEREKYGVFLADYCEYMSQQGVPIAILSIAKEWTSYVSAYKSRDVTNKLNSELDARNITRPEISEQGFWSISQGISFINKVAELGTQDLYSSFCSHNYANEDPEKWVEIIEKSQALGRPMYDDETSTGSGSPTSGVERAMYKQITEYIKKAERYEAGLCGEIYFEIWSRGQNTETRSIYFPSGGTGKRLRGYYMMQHFSNNILDSKYVTATISSLSKVYTIQFRKGDQVVLWVINKSTTEYPLVPITVDAFKIEGAIDVHYWTDNTPIEGIATQYTALGNVFETGIPAESMSCFKFNVIDESDNLALSGVATQSSTQSSYSASLAINDNVDGVLSNGSAAQTTQELNPWWQLDLGANDTIGSINLFNTTEEGNLADFTVSIMDAQNNVTFTQSYTSAPDSLFTIDAGNVIGKVLKIQLNGTHSLSLAEVQVLKGSIVKKIDQTISFSPLETMKYSTETFSPGATCSSGLGLVYVSSNTDVAIIVNGKISITGVGKTNISASRAASATYNAALAVSQELTVTKADQQIIFSSLVTRNMGDPSFTLGATVTSGLALVYVSSDISVATVEGDRIIIVGEGSSIITATQPGDHNYNAASDVIQTLTIEKAVAGSDTDVTTLDPTDDTFIRGGSHAGENYGTGVEMLIKETTSADFHRKSFLQFDVYDISELGTAVLRLYASSSKASQITVFATSDDWDESTLTYNNAPSPSANVASVAISSAGIYYEWDVTSYVKSQISGDNIVSFIVADVSSNKNNISFSSKEADTNRPQLVITKENTSNAQLLYTKAVLTGFPNPAHDFVNLTAENTIKDVLVTSISGQKILKLNSLGQKHVKVALDNFSKGVYFFHISYYDGLTNTLKVLVE